MGEGGGAWERVVEEVLGDSLQDSEAQNLQTSEAQSLLYECVWKLVERGVSGGGGESSYAFQEDCRRRRGMPSAP